MASDFAAGQRKAVADYFSEVLAVQSYPGDFPTGVKIAYKPAAQEMIGAISQREFNKGIIITTSGYTSAAREEAGRLGIMLYEGERLLWLLRHHLHREYTIIDTDRRKPPIRKPPPASGPR